MTQVRKRKERKQEESAKLLNEKQKVYLLKELILQPLFWQYCWLCLDTTRPWNVPWQWPDLASAEPAKQVRLQLTTGVTAPGQSLLLRREMKGKG